MKVNEKDIIENWYKNIQQIENENLDEDKECREVMISCMCGKLYITWFNGNSPIPTVKSENLPICPGCDCSPTGRISGHSAGVFNASTNII